MPVETSNSDFKLLLTGVILAVAIFAFDLAIPLGVAAGVLYMVVVLLAVLVEERKYILIAAVAGSALTLLGYHLSPPSGGVEAWKVLFNRGLSLFAIWISAGLGLYLKQTYLGKRVSEDMLTRISHLQSRFIADPGDKELFLLMLQDLLFLTQSTFGFVGRVLNDSEGKPYLKTFGNAATNIAWNAATRKFYADNIDFGIELHNMDSLFGEVFKTGKRVIANDAPNDPRRGGVPEGHPAIQSFLGLPLIHRGATMGVVGLANRPGGYDGALIDDIQTVVDVCSNIVGFIQTRDDLLVANRDLEASKEQYRKIYDQLCYLVEGTSMSTGEGFFRSLVACLAPALEARWVLVGELSEDGLYIRTLAVWDKDKGLDNFTYRRKDTPCEKIVAGEMCFYSRGVQDLFPKDDFLREMGVEGYMGVPLFDSSGAVLGLIAVCHDGPLNDLRGNRDMLAVFASRAQAELERKRAEAELNLAHRELEKNVVERTQELKRSNQDLEDFAYVASHDLQEPLRKIITFGDRLKEDSAAVLSERSMQYLMRMESAAIRMRSFIDDLLHYSRVNTSGQAPVKESLKAVVEKVVSTVLEEAIVRLEGQVEVGELPEIEMDKTQMAQLFQNLIYNALKFRKPDVAPVVRVSSRVLKGGFYEIAVEDNGIGFDEKYLNRIFKPFERLHGRSQYEGTGIGLALCRKIVQRHGGLISAKSTVGQGATFLVVLPEKQEAPSEE